MKLVSKIKFSLIAAAVAVFVSCNSNNGKPVEVEVIAESEATVVEEQPVEQAEAQDSIPAEPVTEEAPQPQPQPEEAEEKPVAEPRTTSTGAKYTPVEKVEGTKFICLTFDDGPSNKTTPKVLDVMEQYGAHCTFFCVGSCITASTKHNLVRAESLGCEIANHTYNHPNMPKKSAAVQIEEVDKTNEKILDAVGHLPVFFRPPYLSYNQSMLDTLGLVAITGTSSDDWVTSKSPDRIVADVMRIARDGAIIVMHDLGANSRTPVALETLVPRLQAEGYTLVTVSELFATKGVTPELHRAYSSVR